MYVGSFLAAVKRRYISCHAVGPICAGQGVPGVTGADGEKCFGAIVVAIILDCGEMKTCSPHGGGCLTATNHGTQYWLPSMESEGRGSPLLSKAERLDEQPDGGSRSRRDERGRQA